MDIKSYFQSLVLLEPKEQVISVCRICNNEFCNTEKELRKFEQSDEFMNWTIEIITKHYSQFEEGFKEYKEHHQNKKNLK